MRLLIFLLLGILFSCVYVHDLQNVNIQTLSIVNMTGNCSSTCYIVTPDYNVTLTEGVIELLYYNKFENFEWTQNGAGGDIGRLYVNEAAAYVFSSNYNFPQYRNCNVTETATYVNALCYQTNGGSIRNNWTFYQNYISLDSNIDLIYDEHMRVYDIMRPFNAVQYGDYQWNGTHNVNTTTDGFYDSESGLGIWALNNRSSTSSIYIHTWDENVLTDYDQVRQGVSIHYNVLAIGRTDGFQGHLMQYIGVRAVNTSSSGNEQYLSVMRCFKDNPSSDCEGEEEPPVGSPSLNWTIWNGTNYQPSNEYLETYVITFLSFPNNTAILPLDQNTTNCLFKVHNNGTAEGDVSISLNDTLFGITSYADDDTTYAGASVITTTPSIITTLAADAVEDICLWQDYNATPLDINYDWNVVIG